jgi:hypothetical protein
MRVVAGSVRTARSTSSPPRRTRTGGRPHEHPADTTAERPTTVPTDQPGPGRSLEAGTRSGRRTRRVGGGLNRLHRRRLRHRSPRDRQDRRRHQESATRCRRRCAQGGPAVEAHHRPPSERSTASSPSHRHHQGVLGWCLLQNGCRNSRRLSQHNSKIRRRRKASCVSRRR